jgi:carboxyl-terminal processing protease
VEPPSDACHSPPSPARARDADEPNEPDSQRVDAAEMEALAEVMRAPSVRAERLPANVARVTIPIFAPGVSTEVARALRGLGDGLVALVLDLRGNPGGDLDAALTLAADFLPEGAVVAHVHEAGGHLRRVVATSTPRWDLPMTILVDRGTASAAELFVASMKASGRATVVGERTYGKTAAQRLVRDGAADTYVRVDVARWSVGDEPSDGGPVQPDVELLPPLDRDDRDDRDPWLQTAWAIVVQRFQRD